MSERGKMVRVFSTNGFWHWEAEDDTPELPSRRRDSCCDETLRGDQDCEGYITQDAAMRAGGRRIREQPRESDAGID